MENQIELEFYNFEFTSFNFFFGFRIFRYSDFGTGEFRIYHRPEFISLSSLHREGL